MLMKKTPAIAPLAVALGFALSVTAHAADGTADDAGGRRPTDLDTVRVVGKVDYGYVQKNTSTATRTDTPLRDVPQSITVVTQDLIHDQAMQNLGDVVRYIPGVGMAQGEGNRDTPVFRGNSSTADMFIDGMRDDTQYFRDLYNIDRVEALKGPNAMIFGRGGAGGVLNRVSKQADWNRVREASLQLGSWNKRRIAADVGQPINDAMAFRVTAMAEDSESYRDGYKAERWGLNPTFAWHAGEDTTITLGYEHFEDDRVADRGIPSSTTFFNGRRLPVDVDASTFFGDPARSPTWADVDAFSALVEHDFGSGWTLRNRTRIADYDKFYQNIYAGGPATPTAGGTMQAELRAYNNATRRRNMFNQTDLVFSLGTGIVHQLLVGAEFGRQQTDNLRKTGYFGVPGSAATFVRVPLETPRYTGPIEFRQSASDADNRSVAKIGAVYVQDQIEFSPRWQAILGLRYDRFEVDFHNNRDGRAITAIDNLLSPRAGLVYKPFEPVSFYASYSMAHLPRSGEQLTSLTATNKAFDPDQFRNREVGAIWDVSPDLALTAALYRLDRTNVMTPDPTDPARSILVDGQRVEGIELGLAGNVTKRWSVMGGYAWQDGEIPGSTAALPNLPRQTASLWNRYDFNDAWGIGLGASYRDKIFAQNTNLVVLKGYTRYDAAVFYAVNSTLELQLNVENLFDKRYYATAHNDNNITPGAPRSAYLGVTLKF
jgi:catecholate siderophore receptor